MANNNENIEVNASSWMPDVLGNGFHMCYVSQGIDYSGNVRCTIIRKKARQNTERGVLYIHGFSDYFFQEEMANRFIEQGYNFYAVDLRKYGRSFTQGQKMFQVRNLEEYFLDIQAGIDMMKKDGNCNIVLLGHSTGGLISSLYMQCMPDPAIKVLVLNSPFLAWNLPKWMVRFGIPLLKQIAGPFPNMKIKGDRTTNYASTLAKHLGGEWSYNTAWKPDVMPDVDAAWIRAIDNGQKRLRQGEINVPILLLHSDKSAKQGDTIEKFRMSDAVLNVDSIAEAGRLLGPNVEDVTIKDGLHDLVLSRKNVRDEVYNTIFRWLEKFI